MDDYLLAQHSSMEWTHWWFRGRRLVLEDILRRFVAPREDLRLLDVGCGAGTMLPILRELGRVSAMDTSPDAVAYCASRFPDVAVKVGRVPEDLPPPESLDVVTCLDVLEHIDDDVEALHAIKNALAPGGLLLCSVPAYMSLWGPHDVLNHHRRRYRRRQLVRLMDDAGLEVVWSSYFNTILFPVIAGVRVVRRLVRRDAPPASDFDVPAGALNSTLAHLLAAERRVLRRVTLPFGVSIAVVARRQP